MENRKILNKNLLTRTITSIILIPIVLFIIITGGWILKCTILLVALLMGLEWKSLTHKNPNNTAPTFWNIIGLLYIATPCVSLLYISSKPEGSSIIIWLLVTIWLSDISAFFIGKLIGGPKLAPKISPNKTWAGFFGAVFVSYLVGLASQLAFRPEHPDSLLALTITISIYAQVGDLLESWLKRKFDIKDSGSMIPGHGGILDRIDGIVLTAPKIALVVMFQDHLNIF